MERKHFYEDGGYTQCGERCIVGELPRARVCICELVQGHEGQCERIATTRLASVKEFSRLDWYRNFVQ